MRRPAALRLGAALTLAGSSLLMVAAPSHADSCIRPDVSDNRRAVVVDNTCSESVRIKVIWHRATDSACTQLAANGGRLIDSRGYPADFDHIESC